MVKPGARNYNLDLLRIIAMLMIVTLHFLGKGQVLTTYPTSSLKYDLAWSIESICLVAVNCYVLLSSYFLLHSKFKIKKIITLTAQVMFYSLGIYLVLLATGLASPSLPATVSALLPTLTGVYWFVSIYMVMYILSPYLNKFLLSLNKKSHLTLIVTLVAIFSAWPTVFVFADSFTYVGLNIANGYSAMWFIVLYSIAAYIRQYYTPSYNLRRHIRYYGITILGVALLFALTSHLGIVMRNGYFASLFTELSAYNSLPVLISSVVLFMVFINLKITAPAVNKTIATLAPLTFAVYLIHENPHIRSILWSKLSPSSHAYGTHFILYGIVSILAIYILCSAIDWVRLVTFTYLEQHTLTRRTAKRIGRLVKRTPAQRDTPAVQYDASATQ